MRSLEDAVREALRAKASRIGPDAVPPLHLPARRRRFAGPVRGGGRTSGAPARNGWFRPATAAVLAGATVAGSVALSHAWFAPVPGHTQRGNGIALSGTDAASRAAVWVAAQVSHRSIVACDPAMCQVLRTRGIPGGELLSLRRGPGHDPLGAAVIVATRVVRQQFGARLDTVYAPEVLASFGSGYARVEIRVTVPGGAPAFRAALAADVAARKSAGAQELGMRHVRASAAARRQLRGGQVDPRLIVILSALAHQNALTIQAFGDSGPHASAAVPFRSVYLAVPARARSAGRPSVLHQLLLFLRQQRPPYGAAVTVVRRAAGQAILRVEFRAPSPLGLLTAPGHKTRH